MWEGEREKGVEKRMLNGELDDVSDGRMTERVEEEGRDEDGE